MKPVYPVASTGKCCWNLRFNTGKIIHKILKTCIE